MARLNLVIPTTILLMLSVAVTLALARSIPNAGTTKMADGMLKDEKNLHLGLDGFGGLGGGATVGGLPLVGGVGGFAGGAGGAGLHLGGNGLGGGLGGVGGGIVP